MAIPLKDFRLTLSEHCLAALESDAYAFDRDMQSIAREILHQWAERKHRAYSMYAKRVLANGMQTELPGLETEEAGRARNQRK